jgi:hypothetical protein
VPPQLSLTLHSSVWPEPHIWVQQVLPPLPFEMQVSPGPHETLQMPPHPSLSPHCFPVQLGWQQVLPLVHFWPFGQVHCPPHPSPELHSAVPLPFVQDGVQQARPPSAALVTHSSPLPQPMQIPPQPSLSPHCLPVQSGWQHEPLLQGMPPGQLHVPPQPSPMPQTPGMQLGWQQPVPPSASIWQLPVTQEVWHWCPQPSS